MQYLVCVCVKRGAAHFCHLLLLKTDVSFQFCTWRLAFGLSATMHRLKLHLNWRCSEKLQDPMPLCTLLQYSTKQQQHL